MITQSLFAMLLAKVLAAPRPNLTPRPGTEAECQMRAWFSMATMPSPRISF